MNNKNPFEIRLDVLKIAQEMLDREMTADDSRFWATVDTMRSSPKEYTPEEIKTYIDNHAAPRYDADKLMDTASALYSFVKRKDF